MPLNPSAAGDGELVERRVAERFLGVSVQLEHVLKAALVVDPLAGSPEAELASDRSDGAFRPPASRQH
jgi:hypothetical protein